MLLPRLLLPRLLVPLEQQRARALMALAQTATGADDTEKSEDLRIEQEHGRQPVPASPPRAAHTQACRRACPAHDAGVHLRPRARRQQHDARPPAHDRQKTLPQRRCTSCV
jgi:hypothetical protein